MFKVFHNDDLNPKKVIKKKKFLKGENIKEIQEWVGADLDMEAEFDAIDEDNDGKIFFEDMAKWALKKNMKIELEKQEKIEKAKIEENCENGNKQEE